ncbi:tripartite tricarboxylate transporter substrate-binding protein [Arenibacterium halophilum]|uniref:Tripartite tricarboxylate transporter substrate binding protein n=1 Tax=Arenibacterium halophilum TaxID=2583821 RepID=A0ABY2WXC1_9RHOB|nr:tripartite tricarboxylate transporter substrate-binding protein [Arenibacterium halophilum]TMV07481.1 tripartite tricarboxylate transporter substrate binding protein [Arenibacterium halophilum]
MKKTLIMTAALTLLAAPAFAEWNPDGPIRLWIGYGAGGGTDVQGRTLAKEIEALRGWKILPENKAGEDGTVMSAQLKGEAADGQTLGFAITTTYDFAPMNSDNLSPEDFTYITTTAGSQMAVLARAESGWQSLADLKAAADAGEQIVWANWGTQVEAGAEIVARALGINVNHLRTKGGKGALNALVSMDANVGWGGGVQKPLVEAGVLNILASAETTPVALAPEKPTLKDAGVDLNLGYQYIITAPAGLPDDIRDEIAGVVAEILNNPESETRQFIEKQYPPAPIITQGEALREQILTTYDANVEMMKALAE